MKKFLLSVLLFGFCFSNPIEISEVVVKEPAPNAKATGGFMKIKNNSDKSFKLVGVNSNFSKVGEIHTHKHVDGMMKMVKIDDLEIPANGEVVLKPGDLHIMFINLTKRLKEGNKVDFNLTFDDNSNVELKNIEVKKIKMMKH